MIRKWFRKKETKEEPPDQPSVIDPGIEEEPETVGIEKDQTQKPSADISASPIPASKRGESVEDVSPPQKAGGLFSRLKQRLGRTRSGFVRQIDQLLLGKKVIDQGLLDELEEVLVTADMGVGTVTDIFDRIRNEVKRNELRDPGMLRNHIRQRILECIHTDAKPERSSAKPHVLLVVGVNGVGKTTTIAKLAYQMKQEGKNVLLVAADTFRAAAIEQLETWGDRVGVPVIKHASGADPSAVAFDGMDAALKQDVDVVIVDTAGRLHTKVNLMEELRKIRRVIGKKIDGAPHEVLLVLDATTGQNAISQAKLFSQATSVGGIALTKLDGTAKGGIVVSIAHDLGIPIRYIGIGEKMEDLRPFNPKEFVEALFATDEPVQ